MGDLVSQLDLSADEVHGMSDYTWSTGHHVDLSKAEVVDTQPFVTAQCLLESWHIQLHPDMLNREKGTLPREYTALLD